MNLSLQGEQVVVSSSAGGGRGKGGRWEFYKGGKQEK